MKRTRRIGGSGKHRIARSVRTRLSFLKCWSQNFLKLADDLPHTMQLASPMPKLCTVVTTSPIDAAIHDAFGKANGINSYDGLSEDFIEADLSHFLNETVYRRISRSIYSTPTEAEYAALSSRWRPGSAHRRRYSRTPQWTVLPENTPPNGLFADGLTHLKN